MLGNDCQITCLLDCSDHIYVGTTEGTVIMLSAENGWPVHKFSLHANQVRVLLKLPKTIKPCICAELPMEKEPLAKARTARFKLSAPTPPVQEDAPFISPIRSFSVTNKRVKLDSSNDDKHPLFACIGDGLANWFGNGNETTQSLEFLTWTDDFV